MAKTTVKASAAKRTRSNGSGIPTTIDHPVTPTRITAEQFLQEARHGLNAEPADSDLRLLGSLVEQIDRGMKLTEDMLSNDYPTARQALYREAFDRSPGAAEACDALLNGLMNASGAPTAEERRRLATTFTAQLAARMFRAGALSARQSAPNNPAQAPFPRDTAAGPAKRPYPHLDGPNGITAALYPEKVALALDMVAEHYHDWSQELSELSRGLSREWPFRYEAEALLENLEGAEHQGDVEGAEILRDKQHCCAMFATIFLRVGFHIGVSFARTSYEAAQR